MTYLQFIRFIHQANTVARPQPIYIIRSTALWKLVGLHVIQPDYRLGHDASMPIPTVALFPPIVVAHTDIVADHMGHGPC